MSKNIYKEVYEDYLKKGLNVVPDKYAGKGYALKGLNVHADRQVSDEEAKSYSKSCEEKGSNVAVMLGATSGIVALDLDTDSPEILDVIGALLPESPVEKRGSKGYTRFFRYTGQQTEMLKFNGNVILEVLAGGKKTTLPPSRHPNGADYVWTSDKTLLDIDVSTLPALPPMLIPHLESKLKVTLGGESDSYGKIVNGRNDELSKKLGTLLEEQLTVDETIKKLVEYDREVNEQPLFTDPNEFRHTDPVSNALLFYSNHLNSINSKRFRDNKEYLSPLMQAVEDVEKLKESARKKSQAVEDQRKLKDLEYTHVPTAIKTLCETLNHNSWVKQPDLTMGAVLATASTLCSRKFTFRGMAPNLYVCNISPSGTGKNSGLSFVKNTLIDLRKESLLGTSDLVSDAGLMDALERKPTMVLPLDEVSGVLQTATNGKSDYNAKLGDLLTELYTTSNDRFLGRALAGDYIKGAVDRPNLIILGCTTPRGFKDSVNISAMEKGLLGRFLLFFGKPDTPAKPVKKVKSIPDKVEKQLQYLASFRPPETDNIIQGRPQCHYELEIEEDADKRLDEIFYELDQFRIDNQGEIIGPVAARLFQQMTKLVIISACMTSQCKEPKIRLHDVEFGHYMIAYLFHNFKASIEGLIFNNWMEKEKAELEKLIENEGPITRPALMRKTAHLASSKRDSYLKELIESERIDLAQTRQEDGTLKYVYYKESL